MKLSSKDIDLIAHSIVDQVYDNSYVEKIKTKKAANEWKEFKKSKNYKQLDKLFKTYPFVKTVNLDKTFFDWTTAASYPWEYVSSIHCNSMNDLENVFFGRIRSRTKVNFPTYSAILWTVKAQLVIECVGWKDLKNVMDKLAKSLKKELSSYKVIVD